VVRTAEQQAQESLGVRVQLQNFALNLSNLRLDVYGVTVDGASPYSNPALLQMQHAEASVRIISILRKKWYLDDIRVDQPMVKVYVDKNGRSNCRRSHRGRAPRGGCRDRRRWCCCCCS